MPTTDLGLTTGQVNYAQQIVAIGKQRNMSQRDILTALTVALDESGLQNYANTNVPESMGIAHDSVGSDHNSVGVFQQQVGIWGSASELMNIQSSTNLFYDALAKVPTRATMTIPEAAQTVQKSGTPDGSNYAAQVDKATQLLDAINGSSSGTTDSYSTGSRVNVDPLKWVSDSGNWKRIGLFLVGAILLLLALFTILKDPVADVARTVAKVTV